MKNWIQLTLFRKTHFIILKTSFSFYFDLVEFERAGRRVKKMVEGFGFAQFFVCILHLNEMDGMCGTGDEKSFYL